MDSLHYYKEKKKWAAGEKKKREVGCLKERKKDISGAAGWNFIKKGRGRNCRGEKGEKEGGARGRGGQERGVKEEKKEEEEGQKKKEKKKEKEKRRFSPKIPSTFFLFLFFPFFPVFLLPKFFLSFWFPLYSQNIPWDGWGCLWWWRRTNWEWAPMAAAGGDRRGGLTRLWWIGYEIRDLISPPKQCIHGMLLNNLHRNKK